MRDLLLTICIPGALIWGLFSARIATLALLWIGFQRPYDFSWGMWRDLPVWQIAFAVAFLSNLFRGELKPKFPFVLKVYMALVLWITVTCFTAYLPERSWLFYQTFMIPLIFGPVLTMAIINDLPMLKASLWVAAGGIGINAVKTGVSLGMAGGSHVTTQISGFVGDNNVFGLTLCLVIGTLMGLRTTLPKSRWIPPLFYFGLFCIIATIIFTKSRGALLTLAVIMVIASLLGGKPIRHLATLAVVSAFTYAVIPAEFFGRLETLENLEGDASAMGRFDNWKLAWLAAVENPVFGIGIGNHIPYHTAMHPEVHARVAHSMYFQLLGEIGFIGLSLYLLMFLGTLWSLFRLWRDTRHLPDELRHLDWIHRFAFWMFCCFVGYSFGSGLLNMLYIEFPWYAMFFSVLMQQFVREELRKCSRFRTAQGEVANGRQGAQFARGA